MKRGGEVKVIAQLQRALCDAGKNWLVVDDLTDSGETLKEVKKSLPLADIATVYIKPNGAELVDYYAFECEQDHWL